MLPRRLRMLGSCVSRQPQNTTGSQSIFSLINRFQARHCQHWAAAELLLSLRAVASYSGGCAPHVPRSQQLHCPAKSKANCRINAGPACPPPASQGTQRLHCPAIASQMA